MKIAIEYDGAYFHSIAGSKEREEKKDNFCVENDICLVRLREKPLKPTPKAINIPCDCSTWDKIEQTCKDVIHYLNPEAEVNISKESYHTNKCNNFQKRKKVIFPEKELYMTVKELIEYIEKNHLEYQMVILFCFRQSS